MHQSNRLRDLLDERGWKNYDVSAHLRVHPDTVDRWVSGGTIPDPRKAELARLLECSIAYLMRWSDERGEPPAQPRQRREAAAS